MKIEQKLFSTYRVIVERLSEYGFDSFSGIYTYSKSFYKDEFEALITIDKCGVLTGKVIEKEFNEEFSQLKIESYRGEFIGEVREEYKRILLDIRSKCFEKVLFVSEQSNRIASLIKERYKEIPDFPFSEPQYKNYGVFRYKNNNKWYAILMNIPKSKLGGFQEEYADVINVKIDESDREDFLKREAIYPSYHMNKKKWVSIILDETISDEKVMEYIDRSRELIKEKR